MQQIQTTIGMMALIISRTLSTQVFSSVQLLNSVAIRTAMSRDTPTTSLRFEASDSGLRPLLCVWMYVMSLIRPVLRS